jgi:hypothetical protein
MTSGSSLTRLFCSLAIISAMLKPPPIGPAVFSRFTR